MLPNIKDGLTRAFFIGVTQSFLIFLIVYLPVLFLHFLSYGMLSSIVIGAAERLEISIIVFPLLLTLPFLILNSIAILVLKDKGRRIGLSFGYLLSILIFILVFSFYSGYVASLQNWDGFYIKILDHKGKLSFDFCSKGPDQFSKDFCLKELAMQNNDVSICDKLKEELELDHGGNSYASGRYPCIADIAIKNNDPLICNKIAFNNPNDKDNLSRKDSCYWKSIPLSDDVLYYAYYEYKDILPSNLNLDLYKTWCPIFKSDFYKKSCDYVLNSNNDK